MLKTRASILCCVLLMGCSTAASGELPPDVAAFIEDREACDHWRGEIPDPDQAERMAEVVGGIERHCTGVDARLQALRAKYAGDATASHALSEFELIEPAP